MRPALLVALVLASGPAMAASTKGLLDYCGDMPDNWKTPEVLRCSDALTILQSVGPYMAPAFRFCAGEQTALQLATTLRYYVRDHPEALSEDHIKVMSAAFRERWPCKD
jgi:hypothetical protein